jgi:DNA (cytosine-5)-methyltransferase 1
MSKKKSHITVTDQFCGAGGSSQGVRNLSRKMGGGLEVSLAMNRWKLAIETHNTNFPDTDHDCADISASEPRRYPSTDILITSPECTNQGPANGKKNHQKQMEMFISGKVDAAAERSRATMWDVVRFAEFHKYNNIIVENVVEARKWVMYDAWLNAMYTLGYQHKAVYLNSRHFPPTPQSRDRMYIIFWKKGNKAPHLDYTPAAHCSKCGKDVKAVQTWKHPGKHFGKYKTQYVYRCPVDGTLVEPYYYAAANCIDWSDIGTKISEREKPLVPNTVRRCNYGLDKYAGNPFVVNDQHSTGIGFRVNPVQGIFSTIPTQSFNKLVTPPFIVKLEHTKAAGNANTVSGVFPTQTTTDSSALITPPFIVEIKGTSLARAITEPLSTATSVGYHGIITNESWSSFISYWYGTSQATHITDPLGTCTTQDTHQLVTYQQGQRPALEDCYYRMIKAPEVKLAMAFDKDYVVLGTARQQVKQCGNAVTPPVMEWLVGQCVETFN